MVRVSPEVWVRERDFTGHSVLAELPVLPGEAKRGRHLLQSRAKTPGRASPLSFRAVSRQVFRSWSFPVRLRPP